jgi:hypothetical protein
MRPVRANPPWLMSDQQAGLSGRNRGCRLPERSALTIYRIQDQSVIATALTPHIDRRSARRLLPIVLFIGIRSNFRPSATRFEGKATVGKTVSGWTSHATSLHEVLNDEAINCFRCFHPLCRDRTRSVFVLAPIHILARPLRAVQTQAPPPADKLRIGEERSSQGPSERPAPDHHLDRRPTGLTF